MSHFKRALIIACSVFMVFLISSSVFAIDGEGGRAGAFLRLGTGARPLGMGGAFTALSDDATACYWNPAGLGQLKSTELACMYSIMSTDRMSNLAIFAQPLSETGAFALSWLNYGVRDIDGRDAKGQFTELFNDLENAFLLSYGKEFSPVLFVGGGFKYLLHTLGPQQATGYGFDAGMILKLGSNVRIGGMVQDIASKIQWDTESELEEEFPMVIRAGISIIPGTKPVKISADMEKIGERDARYRVGAECWLFPALAARVGYNKDHITAGGSLTIPISSARIQLDYAYAPDILQQSPTHMLSMTVKL